MYWAIIDKTNKHNTTIFLLLVSLFENAYFNGAITIGKMPMVFFIFKICDINHINKRTDNVKYAQYL